MNAPSPLHAFAGYGIELEYMIVDRNTLSVLPIADRLLGDGGEIPRGHFGWSNEVALHVIELKNARPDSTLSPLASGFQAEVRAINAALEPLGACLMPTAMHPWMNPATETRLWSHDHADIYRTYDRIFDCERHGWANLQSMHLNLPFADDVEFARLHAAIRLLLPILPALAASSPFADGRFSGFLDTRMENYRGHQIAIPATIGDVIPDSVASIADYHAHVLAPMYDAIAPLDPEHILRHEWLNARGAIPRFDRNALEIRVIDAQECPQADLAIAAAASAVVQVLYDAGPHMVETHRLAAILSACIHHAEEAVIDDVGYLNALGFPWRRCQARELWQYLIETRLAHTADYEANWQGPLEAILRHGPLARRILKTIGSNPSQEKLAAVYRELCDCLERGEMFNVH
jgi:gamma-glutamyl:cysteine ligase YbdK (ATP-grasp superfamily)